MPGTLGEFDMRVAFAVLVIEAFVFAAGLGPTPSYAGDNWPKAIYSSTASNALCIFHGKKDERLSCEATFEPISTGQYLTVSHVSCRLTKASAESIWVEAAVSTAVPKTSRSQLPDSQRLIVGQPEMVDGRYSNLSWSGQAFLPGGVTPTINVSLKLASTSISNGRIDCTMQGRLSSM
jgi:hypothetical protein